METILITGSSGFIGFHTAKKLLEEGKKIIGFDNENEYYDVSLKYARRKLLEKYPNFIFFKGDLENFENLYQIFENYQIDRVIHLAAQAGVRYSLVNPFEYIQSNLVGFYNIIELSKQYRIRKFVYASSSSVYGKSPKESFSIEDRTDNPISLYAATKKSNELIAYSYSHLFGLSTIGLRFFTVYGPWGRPDMSIFIFTDKILKGEPIDIFNHGKMKRDFTYIDDIVEGIIQSLNLDTEYELFNLGANKSVDLDYLIGLIEKKLGLRASKKYLSLQKGDMITTGANIDYSKEKLSWKPNIGLEEGIARFVERFKFYYYE